MELAVFPRRALLAAAHSRRLRKLAERYGQALGVRRFVAGETVEEALQAVQALNREGLGATLAHLGEDIREAAEARAEARRNLELLEALAGTPCDATVSVKLTALGLAVDPALCRELLFAVVARAARDNRFVRIDMESSRHTDATLELFREVRQQYDNVGTVIQAYLYRSVRDVRSLARLNANLRLVKGAYREPPSVAYQRKRDVDENLRRLIRLHLVEEGCPTAVGSHDEAILRFTQELVQRHDVPLERLEFQLLYGLRPAVQRDLRRQGYRTRIYVPYGSAWYPYFLRRLAERPANLAFVLRSLIRP